MLKLLYSLLLLMIVYLNLGWLWTQTYLMFYSFLTIIIVYDFFDYNCIFGVLGGDLMSSLLIFLSFWLCGLMILSSQIVKLLDDGWKMFIGLVLSMSLLLFMTFSVLDLFWFYIFFELVLIPTFFMIIGWGVQPERLQAGMYMLFYTIGASLPLLIGIINLYNTIGSLNYFINWWESSGVMSMWFITMMMAFLVKLPMFMLHLWLPKAHVEAPVAGSMILAGVLLKLGGYGLYRMMMIYYINLIKYSGWMISLCVIGGIVISFICLCQVDLKSLIAYSSVMHMGLLLAGYMTLSSWGMEGGLVTMIAHGLCSSGLFCLVNIFYERFHSRGIIMIKGMMLIFPSLGLFWFLMSMCNMSSPPSINLLGEVMLMISLIGWSSLLMVFIFILSFMSVAYTIYMYSVVQHGKSWFIYSMNIINIREYLLLFCHLVPLNYLIVVGEEIGGWLI